MAFLLSSKKQPVSVQIQPPQLVTNIVGKLPDILSKFQRSHIGSSLSGITGIYPYAPRDNTYQPRPVSPVHTHPFPAPRTLAPNLFFK